MTHSPSDPKGAPELAPFLNGFAADMLMCLRFFSRLPTGSRPHEAPDLGRIARVLPIASIVIGIIPVLVLILGDALGLPAAYAAALAVASMVIVGGGMMEDATADAADGLFGGMTVARRLEIFKDSRHGTYGVAALCLFLILRVAAITAMTEHSAIMAGVLWLAAHGMGRSAGLWMAVALPLARADGVAATAGSLAPKPFWIGTALATVLFCIACAYYAGEIGTAIALVAVALVVFGWTKWCKRLVGGQTGDLLGSTGALAEVAAITILLMFI